MKSSVVAVSLVPRFENCVRAMVVSCSADKAGEVPQENVFICSYNILHVSEQGSSKLLSGAELQVVFAAGYRVTEQKLTIHLGNIHLYHKL